MPAWAEVEHAAPELAAAVKERFEATGLAFVATLRADGSPRISGIEPLFAGGELWLGMMPDSRKAKDVQRDPRFALHCATVDKQLTQGDAKISGRARPAEDEGDHAPVPGGVRSPQRLPPHPRPPVPGRRGRAVHRQGGGNRLVVEWWREGGEPQRVERT